MEIIQKSEGEGFAHLKVTSGDDLWYLHQVIGPGDRVKKRTKRTMLDGREKKSVVIQLEVEKTELQDDRLRLTGEIVEGAENIELGYHTFNVEEDEELRLWKDFSDSDWETLEKAASSKAYRVLFCIAEEGKADFYEVRESGIEDISSLNENLPGKMYSDQKSPDFIGDVKSAIERVRDEYDAVVLAGPGFFKKKLYNSFEDREGLFAKDTSVTGKTGLHESIKRGALKDIVESSRIDEETELMQRFFEQLEKDGEISYGPHVEKLVERGAVEKLLITPEKFRERQQLVEKVKHQGGDIQKIHTDHEPGKRLENMGGLAAFLRYKPDQGLD
ncbi:MAG: mRNA surveillance protein pelota [Candidatus Nanohaloarchaea archaeon]